MSWEEWIARAAAESAEDERFARERQARPNGHDAGADLRGEAEPLAGGISVDDFYAYMPMHNYIYIPDRSVWPGTSIDSRIAARWP